MTAAAWSVPVRLGELGRGSASRSLEADAAARARIAALLSLDALDGLTATVEVVPWMDGAVVRARWTAAVVQTCGLSLDPVPSSLNGAFEVRCVPADSPLAPAVDAELVLDPDAEDPPDVLESDVIDLGAYVVEHLALELDPFPRAPGVSFEPPEQPPEPNPFAVLVQLKPGG